MSNRNNDWYHVVTYSNTSSYVFEAPRQRDAFRNQRISLRMRSFQQNKRYAGNAVEIAKKQQEQ